MPRSGYFTPRKRPGTHFCCVEYFSQNVNRIPNTGELTVWKYLGISFAFICILNLRIVWALDIAGSGSNNGGGGGGGGYVVVLLLQQHQ